jgi:hypothetical protein
MRNSTFNIRWYICPMFNKLKCRIVHVSCATCLVHSYLTDRKDEKYYSLLCLLLVVWRNVRHG